MVISRRHRRRLALLPWLLAALASPTLGLAQPAAPDGTPPPERVVWDRSPIGIVLPIGTERRIQFPGPVELGLPPDLSAQLRAQIVNESVYLLAEEEISPHRIQIRDRQTGQVYLADLSSRPGAPEVPLIVANAAPPTPLDTAAFFGSPATAAPATSTQRRAPAVPDHDYVALLRFAARQVYGPPRLAYELPGVSRAPVSGAAIGLLRGAHVAATPVASWRAGQTYITVVRLTNRSPRDLVLDPRDLRGAWLTATFQHGRLLPAGDVADTTAAYLMSARPFADALRAAP